MYNYSTHINKMKGLLVVYILLILFAGKAYSYPQGQMDDCISSALSNPSTKSISRTQIKNYCDCALKAIIDEKKDIRKSGLECAQRNFN